MYILKIKLKALIIILTRRVQIKLSEEFRRQLNDKLEHVICSNFGIASWSKLGSFSSECSIEYTYIYIYMLISAYAYKCMQPKSI